MYANKKFSYRKQIARQHSVTKGFGQTWGMVKLTQFPFILPGHYASLVPFLIKADFGRKWQLYPTPRVFSAPLRGFPLEFCNSGWTEKLE